MSISKLPRVCFLRVTDNSSKLQKLCALIHSHFVKHEKVFIVVPSNEAAVYIDQLLWRMPEESFVPHAIVNSSTKEQVAITTSRSNLNQATLLVNLAPGIHSNVASVNLIYELLDLTSAEKEAVSRKKQADYQSAGYQIEEVL